jgi:CDP-glucose 4,6-dehydratase
MENMVIKNNFWKNKKVLITGHTGFKGSWLSLWLNQLGAKVYGISLLPKYNPNFYTLASLRKIFHKSIILDINFFEELKKEICQIQPDLVFHLAAQPLVYESIKNPRETYKTNIIGTVNILETLKDLKKCKAFINITSDKCYQPFNKKYYSEDDKLGGIDPYSASKSCSEIITNSYSKIFLSSIGVATVRAGNIFGGGDWSENRLIPDLIRALKCNNELYIRSKKSVRPWQFILEPLNGYILLAEKIYKNPKKFSGAWNFGPDEANHLTVNDLMNICKKSYPKLRIKEKANNVNELDILMLNSKKSKKELHWKPKYTLQEGIKKTLNWYSLYLNNQSKEILEFSKKEIDLYINK